MRRWPNGVRTTDEHVHALVVNLHAFFAVLQRAHVASGPTAFHDALTPSAQRQRRLGKRCAQANEHIAGQKRPRCRCPHRATMAVQIVRRPTTVYPGAPTQKSPHAALDARPHAPVELFAALAGCHHQTDSESSPPDQEVPSVGLTASSHATAARKLFRHESHDWPIAGQKPARCGWPAQPQRNVLPVCR